MGHSEKISREGCKIISKIVQRGEISQVWAKKLEPKHCHASHLIGYPKIHKKDVLLRGIFHLQELPTKKLQKN